MEKVFGNPKYKGKHIVVVGDKIFAAASGKRFRKILDWVHEKYPDQTPAITYIPKAETLILRLE